MSHPNSLVKNNTIKTLITDNIDLWTSAIKKRNGVGRGGAASSVLKGKIELTGIKKLRELILELAVRGKLVPQDDNDEPASVLLERIAKEKAQLIADKNLSNKKQKQKPLPAITEEEKPFELPKGWEFERLGNCSTVFSGSSFKSGDFNSISGIRVIKITNAGVGKLIETDEFLPESFLEKYQSFQVFRNDMILALTRPYISDGLKVSLCPDSYHESLLNQRVAAIRAFQYPEYLFLNLRSPYILNLYKNRFGGNGLQPNLKMSDVTELVVAIPPLAEQHRIVAKVDELMALCDQLEQQTEHSLSAHKTLVEVLLAALIQSKNNAEFQQSWQQLNEHFDLLFTTEASIEQLKQTILQLAVMGKLVPQNSNDEPASVLLERIAAEKAQLIADKKIKKQKPLPVITDEEKPFTLPSGWSFSHMQDICSLITDGTHQTPKYSDSGRPFISAQCVKPFNFMPENCRYVSEEHYQNYIKNRKPEFADVLLARVGAGIGEAAKIDTDLEFAIYVSTGLLKPFKEFLLSEYLVLWLNSPVGRGYSERNTLGKGVSQGNLNLSLIRAFVISIPPLAEQHRIVAKVDELMALCAQLKTRLTEAQTTQLHLADAVVSNALNEVI
ncbi:MAG: restriction endonuclease subunit S [Alteromonadaceae bacterium]|nr:restriction endonuclease subunit S [Alteromonadaceae bacterium]